MLGVERLAILNNRVELCEALTVSAEVFLSNLHLTGVIDRNQRKIIERLASDQDKIIETLEILKHKDRGFIIITEYLRANGMSKLADKLEYAEQTDKLANMGVSSNLSNDSKSEIVDRFIADLVDFYLGNYRAVESFADEEESIESVWVKVHLEKNFDSSEDYDEIFAHMSNKSCRLALVKGQPGSGKTTLVKKIAYDWAKLQKKQNGEKNRFDLILAAPLRSIHSWSDPLEIAVSYILEINRAATGLSGVERVSDALRSSALKILVILDGLDEYQFQPDSILAKMFSVAFTAGHTRNNLTPIQFKYDLLVTSRPYACQTINENLLTHKWEITGFTEAGKKEFVHLRCKTEIGKKKAIEYLENSTDLSEISQIPLLLLLVCFLSDQNVHAPTNLTGLYETFVLRMLIRSIKRGSIDPFDLRDWRNCDLVKSLGSLALLGVIRNNFEFTTRNMELCRVGQDCFASSLLLFKSDPVSLEQKADFPHRSIQEFLAALHAFERWLTTSTISDTTGWPNEIWPIEGMSDIKVEMLVAKLIGLGDSQFCRFYFGLCSGQPEFEVKIRNSLEEYLDVYIIASPFLFCLSHSLADCSDAECFLTGKIVNSLVNKSFNSTISGMTEVQAKKQQIFLWTEKKRIEEWPHPKPKDFRLQFQSGLKLKWLGNSYNSFYQISEKKSEAKMIQIWLGEENLVDEFGVEKVEWLWIGHPGLLVWDTLKSVVELINLLPKCRNCRVEDDSLGTGEYFIIRLWLERISDSKKIKSPATSGDSGVNKEFLCLQIENSLGEEVFNKFLSQPQKTGEFEIKSVKRTKSKEGELELVVSCSWSVWDFLLSENGRDGPVPELESPTRPRFCSLS